MSRDGIGARRGDEEEHDRRSGRTWSRRVVRACAAGVIVGSFCIAAPASAHVIVTPSTTAAGANALLRFSVGHGCKGSPTTKITIQIPAAITSVTPTRTALWKVEKRTAKLDPPTVDAHGNQIVEHVASVTFTAHTPLPEGYRDVLELAVQLPDAEGTRVDFPTIQTCEKGESAWIEVPRDGVDVKDLESPAPSLVISEAEQGGHHGASSAGTTTAGDAHAGDAHAGDARSGDAHSGEAPATGTEPDGGDALTPAALAAGVLGSVLGGAALVQLRRRT